ncbi:hypothetical protein EJB05_22265, partial [Eragrostis curvula]
MPTQGSAMIDADDHGSASAIVAGTATGHHVLHVEGYSRTKEELPNGRFVKSRPFSVGGRSWCIHYYPNGASPRCAEYVSLFLAPDEDVAAPFKARAKFSLLDRAGKPLLFLTRRTRLCEYAFPGSGYGFDEFVKREFLEKSKHLSGDCFRIRCDIDIVEELRTEDRAAAPPFISIPPSDIHKHFGDLLSSNDGTDVTFQVAGQTFKAHRYILAVRSQVFKAQLLGMMRESRADEDYCIRIDDMQARVFSHLLHFVYTDFLPEMDRQEEALMAQHLLEAADRYDMQRLKLICEDNLSRHLEVSTVATTLVLAEQHNCEGLKQACIAFFKSRYTLEAVMATDGFEHLSKSCPALRSFPCSTKQKPDTSPVFCYRLSTAGSSPHFCGWANISD